MEGSWRSYLSAASYGVGADADGESMYRAPGFVAWRPCASSSSGKPKFQTGSNSTHSKLASRGGVLDALCIGSICMAGKFAACRYVGAQPKSERPIARSDLCLHQKRLTRVQPEFPLSKSIAPCRGNQHCFAMYSAANRNGRQEGFIAKFE